MNLLRKIVVVGLLASIAGCTKPPPPPPPPPPPAPPPVVIVIPPRPLPPGNAAVTQILPGRALDGRFQTANSNILGDRAFWQMKIALNVAAIGCRGAEERFAGGGIVARGERLQPRGERAARRRFGGGRG